MKKLMVTPDNQEGTLVDLTAEEVTFIRAEEAASIANRDANQYKIDRTSGTSDVDAKGNVINIKRGYPSLTDQADMAYWDRQDGTTTLDDAIAAVKAEFPKP
jgi:hypothetical protein